MDITIQQQENIQRYLDGELDAAAAGAFLREVEADKNLAQALDIATQIRNAPFLLVQHEDAAAIRAMAIQAGEEWENERKAVAAAPVKKMNIRRMYWLAAATIVALSSVWLLWTLSENTAPPSPDTLFARYYKKEPAPPQKPDELRTELEQYEAGNYEPFQELNIENIPKGRGAGDDQQIEEMAHYFRGQSAIEKGNYEDAAVDLQWVISNTTQKELRAKAEWYLALAMLKRNDRNAAVKLLESVAGNEAAPHRKEAAKLLKLLKK
ncbi:MAG: tetratricopeptide repeat protein [Pseudobacter sp.]|uniref:tetratricopeptide repeat protein n=1 Tax=Pseudobacter sp. TaxID=2045420 RepID=UPI003F7F4F5D